MLIEIAAATLIGCLPPDEMQVQLLRDRGQILVGQRIDHAYPLGMFIYVNFTDGSWTLTNIKLSGEECIRHFGSQPLTKDELDDWLVLPPAE